MWKKIFIVNLIFPATFCYAQKMDILQPEAKFITGFPFQQFSGGIILVKALLNDIPDSLNFILDTGNGGISLDSTTCVQYGIEKTPTDTTISGMGETHKVSFAFNQTLHFPGLTIKRLDFHINDYDLLSSVYGEKINGIIGYSFLRRYIVKVDYDSMWIEVYNPGRIKYPKEGVLLHPSFTNIPIQPLQIEDSRKIDFNFYFDMGAALCLLMNKDFVTDSSVLSKRHHPVITQAEGVGGRLQMQLTIVKKVQIGPFKFRWVPTYIYTDKYNVTSYPNTGGLIGNDLLRRFNLIINYPKYEIYLLPNTHFKDEFDYAYTGFAIYYINGEIIVDDVIPKSPADIAGLKKGDILIGVETNVSNNIQQYKTLLQFPNKKINLFIRSKNELFHLILKPTVIL